MTDVTTIVLPGLAGCGVLVTGGASGIGLALCRKIIDNHCGIIYAEGNPKLGSTFRFILPTTQ